MLFHVMQSIGVLALHGDDQLGLHLFCVRSTLQFFLLRTVSLGDEGDIPLFLT